MWQRGSTQMEIQFKKADVCVRERKGCVGCKVPEFLITRGQSDSSGHLS